MEIKPIKLDADYFLSIPGFPVAVVPFDRYQSQLSEIDYSFYPHCHTFQELVIVTSGSGIQNINGVDYPISAGDIFLLQGNDIHYYKECTRNSMLFYNILYDQDKLPLPLNYFRMIHGYNMVFRTEPGNRMQDNFANHLHLHPDQLVPLEKLVMSIHKALKAPREGTEAECVALLIQLILQISRFYDTVATLRDDMPQKINMIISKLEKNYACDYTLAGLAAEANTSPRNFSRQFRRITRTSPIEYLLRVRLRHAADMLTANDLSISQVAAFCGFSDSNYFTKKFTEKYSISPRKYRNIYGHSR